MSRKLALLLLVTLVPALAWGDTLQISCVAPTSCTGGSVTQITKSTQPTFDLLNAGQSLSGEGYLAVLVPGPSVVAPSIKGGALDETITFSQGKLGDPGNLNEPGMSAYPIGSIIGASEQVGGKPSSFTVYEFDLGAYSSAGKGKSGIYVDVNGLTRGGDVLLGWVEYTTTKGKTKTNGLEWTPLANSLTVDGSGFRSFPPPSPTPEPTSLLLLGTGLMAIGKLIRRNAARK